MQITECSLKKTQTPLDLQILLMLQTEPLKMSSLSLAHKQAVTSEWPYLVCHVDCCQILDSGAEFLFDPGA